MPRIGRTSKIDMYSYQDEIHYLRGMGYSYQKIAEELNKNHPENNTLGKDTICRYYAGLTKKARPKRTIEVTNLVSDMLEEFFYKLRNSNLSKNEKQSLIYYLKAKQRRLEGELSKISSGRMKLTSEVEQIRSIITAFSRRLCPKCKELVVSEVLREEEKRKVIPTE